MQKKSISGRRPKMNQNSRLVDIFVGIKAKTVIKRLIPDLKTQFEGKPKVFHQETLHRHQKRQIHSSKKLKRHMCLKVFNQELNLLIKVRYFTSKQLKSYFCQEFNEITSADYP